LGQLLRSGIGWFTISPWRILLTGVVVALAVAAATMVGIMRPPMQEVATLVRTLAATSVLSVAAGYFLYRQGWTRSPSLSFTLILSYIWAAVLTLINVWIMARLMFVSYHDLTLAGVLLLFAVIIATTFGVFVAATVTDGLRQLARTARRVATGDLSARAAVAGRDEVSQAATAFNEMAVQLEQAARQRQEVETLRRDLIAWTSHDLRTPLTSIRVMVEALHDGMVEDPETVQRYYRTIRADVVALNNLIDDLFELAQLDTGNLKLEKEAHSLGDLISDTLESFRAIAGQRQVALDGEVGPNLDPVRLNAPKIGRTLANLVGNALQYTPAGGLVRVTARRTAEGVEVSVVDSGPGFAEADLPRVFEKFYRGEQARSRATGGAGLGLAIAKGIVEAHGGRIWAENGDGRGARISFTLPK
jgi:two-component system sensor histidine kinase BaeS